MSRALSILRPSTGEVTKVVDAATLLAAAGILDVADAGTAALAAFDADTRELESIAREARGVTSDELVSRLDANAKWTLREGGYEIKAPSPEAGTVAYDTEKLKAALAGLLDDGVISAEGAQAAVATVQPTAPVSYAMLHRIRVGLLVGLSEAERDALVDGLDTLLAAEPAPVFVQKPGGIKALLKIPGARAAIEACRVEVEPPRRSAKVKAIAP